MIQVSKIESWVQPNHGREISDALADKLGAPDRSPNGLRRGETVRAKRGFWKRVRKEARLGPISSSGDIDE